MEIVYAVVVGQIAVVGMLFRWLQIQVRDNKIRVDKLVVRSYTKAETKEVIDMKLQPLVVGIEHVQKDVTELKHMIGRLLDEKNKK